MARKLITDASEIVFGTTAELAKEELALMAELRKPELLGYVAIHIPIRLPTLYSTILSSSRGQLQEVIEMLVLHVLETPTDADLLFHALDWSGGVPDVLIDQQLLGSGVDNQIRLAILNRMQQSRWQVPERWMDDMELIAGTSDISLAGLARELLGIPLHIDISLSTQYQESDADLQPSVLNQLESMEFREDT